MTDAERRLFQEALIWYKRYSESNPDAGLPMSDRSLILHMSAKTETPTTQQERDYLEKWLARHHENHTA